jgi:alkylation response protein AidB-like acyl-CoA dehydrogenase
MTLSLDAGLLSSLAAHAETADSLPHWPAASWQLLRDAGVLAWSIPREFSGFGWGPVDVLQGYEILATACLTTTFALSQREAAIRRLLTGPDHLKARWLPALARGDAFLTVGLSQLTTSRQHGAPALRATRSGRDGFRLDGEIPWVTGADRAQAVLVGAVLEGGLQVLFVLPTDRPGVAVETPLALASLVGSRTSLVRCSGVEVSNDCLLAGPAERVLGAVGGGGLETSCLALGLAGAAVDYLRGESLARPHWTEVVERLEAARVAARSRLHELAATTPGPEQALALRVDCTRLALRATQIGLLAAKGIGFVTPHPAQRWARQALFFLVWSCPRPVSEGVLSDLLSGV